MDTIPELTIEQVARRLGEAGFYVYDNNSHARWRRSHVPGAQHKNPYTLERSDLPADPAATLVFYCAGPG